MKKFKLLTLFILFALTLPTLGQQRPRVSGSGNVVTKDRDAAYFNSVMVSTGIDLILSQGSTESIKVEADDNLHEYIVTEINGNTLKIYTDANIRDAEEMNVYVTMKDVEALSATSAGDISGKTVIKSDELTLTTSSAGDIKLEVEVSKLNCSLSSAGDMTISGTTDELVANLSSAGDLQAYDLTSRIADVSTSSSGDAKITVTEKLKARASSAGDIQFQGNPKEVDGHSSSAGRIEKR
ncbi:MAG: DUF2807 domain-containing protein [Bacteroidales bacterium]|nr:MAG: DUF2807 domain-containing protein [Bacteroidales bacterium]